MSLLRYFGGNTSNRTRGKAAESVGDISHEGLFGDKVLIFLRRQEERERKRSRGSVKVTRVQC